MADLIFAFPSKGRIQKEANQFFGNDFLDQSQNRNLQITVPGISSLRGVLLPAAEIALQLRRGDIHIGLTGEDLICETSTQWQDDVIALARLPFAQANLIIAVPQSWIDVHTMEDLDDAAINFRKKHGRRMRFATKYPHLTRAFFSQHGLIDYRLLESGGASEAAPTQDHAEAICDITSTGKTIKANGLKPIQDGTILQSQATLFASRTALWDEEQRQTTRVLFEKMKLDLNLLKALD